MIDSPEAVIAPGEKVLVIAEAGTGKNALVHVMAGLWPWGSGEILRPEGAHISFMPQRPYFPLGTLRDALLYPHPRQDAPDARIEEILTDAASITSFGVSTRRISGPPACPKVSSNGSRSRACYLILLEFS
jgi:putative ATP-binding cassette transporter